MTAATGAGGAAGERAPARGGGKVPRVDYHKYLHGGAAGRRELVHGFGDALREHGCARLQGHGEVGDAATAAAVGGELLAALEDYFGLPAAALQELAEGGAERVDLGVESGIGERAERVLLVLVPEVAQGAAIRLGGAEWSRVSANRGELLAVPGAGLSRLTAGVVPAAEARLPAGCVAWCICAPAGAALAPRPEFCA